MLTRDSHAADFRHARRYYESVAWLVTAHNFPVVRLSLFLSVTIYRIMYRVDTLPPHCEQRR